MTARDFFELVARMRRSQKEYQTHRSRLYLRESKELEQKVDAEIERVEHSPRLYDLYLSPGVSSSTLPKVLAHECVHLAQYASGRLSVQGSTVMFDGQAYKYDLYDSFSPWEDEAFKTQTKLLKLIKK